MSTIADAPNVTADEHEAAEAIAIADRFIDGTNELDPPTREELIRSTWTPDGNFVDPLFEASGYDEMEALFEQVHTTYPGHVFVRVGEVDRLQHWIRFRWEFRGEDASVLAAGTDTAELGDDGRLVRIVSFYDPVESN